MIAIRERYGARAVALAKGTGGGTSVSDAERWLARFLNRFGSPNWTSTTHVCNWHKDTGFTYTFGVEIPTPDVAHSGAFLLWGHNPSSTSLILAHDIVAAKKRGMKIVAVDPRRVGIAAQADVLLASAAGHRRRAGFGDDRCGDQQKNFSMRASCANGPTALS